MSPSRLSMIEKVLTRLIRGIHSAGLGTKDSLFNWFNG